MCGSKVESRTRCDCKQISARVWVCLCLECQCFLQRLLRSLRSKSNELIMALSYIFRTAAGGAAVSVMLIESMDTCAEFERSSKALPLGS